MAGIPALPRKYHAASIWLLYAAGLLPAVYGFWLGATGRLPGNPVKEFEHVLGLWALRFLVATLAITPLRRLTGGDDGETQLADGMGDPNADTDIGRIVYAYRQWRGEPAPEWWNEAEHGAWKYVDIPGFCKSETIEGIDKQGFVLTPGRYVGAEEQEDDGEPFEEKYPRLLAELEECFNEGERLTKMVRERLEGIRDVG